VPVRAQLQRISAENFNAFVVNTLDLVNSDTTTLPPADTSVVVPALALGYTSTNQVYTAT
jgi:hypothetical protein